MTKLFLLCPFHALVFLLRESVLLFCEIMNVRVGCSFLLLAWRRSSLYDWSARYHSTEEDTRGSSSGGAPFKHRVPSRDRQGPTTSPVQTTNRQTDTYTVYRGETTLREVHHTAWRFVLTQVSKKLVYWEVCLSQQQLLEPESRREEESTNLNSTDSMSFRLISPTYLLETCICFP